MQPHAAAHCITKVIPNSYRPPKQDADSVLPFRLIILNIKHSELITMILMIHKLYVALMMSGNFCLGINTSSQ